MKKVFLISGKLRSGKNQFAEYLDQQYQLNEKTVRQDLFAKKLKDWSKSDYKPLVEIINNIADQISNALHKHKNYLGDRYPAHGKFVVNPFDDIQHLVEKLKIKDENFYEDKTEITRVLLQTYGTEIFRQRVDNEFWVKELIKSVKESEEDINIITDVRFPNEIESLMDDPELDVTTIRINRDMDRDSSINEHPSETALDDYTHFDFIVDNNGTLEDLWNAMDTIYNIIQEETEKV